MRKNALKSWVLGEKVGRKMIDISSVVKTRGILRCFIQLFMAEYSARPALLKLAPFNKIKRKSYLQLYQDHLVCSGCAFDDARMLEDVIGQHKAAVAICFFHDQDRNQRLKNMYSEFAKSINKAHVPPVGFSETLGNKAAISLTSDVLKSRRTDAKIIKKGSVIQFQEKCDENLSVGLVFDFSGDRSNVFSVKICLFDYDYSCFLHLFCGVSVPLWSKGSKGSVEEGVHEALDMYESVRVKFSEISRNALRCYSEDLSEEELLSFARLLEG